MTDAETNEDAHWRQYSCYRNFIPEPLPVGAETSHGGFRRDGTFDHFLLATPHNGYLLKVSTLFEYIYIYIFGTLVLDEVVVVGYTTQPKTDLTGAVT